MKKETILYENKEYVLNKRYYPDDELNGFVFQKYWSKKNECFIINKYPVKRKYAPCKNLIEEPTDEILKPKSCEVDGKTYLLNKHYYENDELKGFYYKRYWSKKEGKYTFHKYDITRNNVKKPGRKRATKRLLIDKIKSMDKIKLKQLYDFLDNL